VSPCSCGARVALGGRSVVIRRGGYRESELPEVPPGGDDRVLDGRQYISVIGIDRYRRWERLDNAVSDARGVLAAFEDLGFVPVVAPLIDDAATAEAIRCLPSNLEPVVGENDSLVVFFAGHGHTTTARFSDGFPVLKGYLIPVDADRDGGRDHTWQRIEHWLSTIAELRARHILVILDSCHSGVALSRGIQYRGYGVRVDGSSIPLDQRRSRRVLTSALDDQQAMDGGPIRGHSVFTGCLIEALRGGASAGPDIESMSVREIAAYVRRRVLEHTHRRQVPDEGRLELDDSGELRLSRKPRRAVVRPQHAEVAEAGAEQAARAEGKRLPRAGSKQRPPSPSVAPRAIATGTGATPPRAQARPPSVSGAPGARAHAHAPAPGPAVAGSERPSVAAVDSSGETCGIAARAEGWMLEPAVSAALDRQGEERRGGAQVLTIVAGDALAAQTQWGTWAARHGYLTLATQAVGLDAVIADLLAQTPWLRCVPEARKRLAVVAQIDVQAVDASLDARSSSERRRWIDDVAGHDPHARVSGWLLSWMRSSAASVPDLTTAPVHHAELLAIACDLASPTAVLLFHPTPDEPWLSRAVVTAAELTAYMPAHSVAVTAPDELVTRTLRDQRRGSAWTMARQGLVRVDALARRLPGRARHGTMRALFDALGRDPRTRGRFELDGRIATIDGPEIDVALVADADRIAVELDAWYHFHDPEGYRRDRIQDLRLQRAGYFVLRFPAEDVDDRLASTIEHLAIALASRRAARAPL
jgi:very-short-patch-repair endonuclease